MCSSSDMWGLGCLVWESFNGPLRNRSNLKDIDNVSDIPVAFQRWCRVKKIFYDRFRYFVHTRTDSKVIDKFILRVGRCVADKSSKSSRYYNQMSQTGRLLQKRFGRHAVVPRRDSNQRQSRKESLFRCVGNTIRQFPGQCVPSKDFATVDYRLRVWWCWFGCTSTNV